jgi:hypothetical protein
MSGSKQQQVSELLHEAAETHHRVFRIVDGADDDWATWYADWLVSTCPSCPRGWRQADPQWS